jgi:hypothetical protein
MQGSRHREHCHRVEKEVRAFAIEARRRQQKDARRKARHPQPHPLKLGSTYFLMLGTSQTGKEMRQRLNSPKRLMP